jgi:sugar phosphate isomerase/epimerase
MDGTIDYPGQIAALAVDGYAGMLSLEPHVGKGPEGMRRCIAGLRAALAEAERRSTSRS